MELSASPAIRPDTAELVATHAPARLHNIWAAVLCAFLIAAIGATAWWIQGREAGFRSSFVEFRTASAERSLLATDAQLGQIFTQVDAIMMPALLAIDGRDPAEIAFDQLAMLRRVALDVVPGRFTLDFWTGDGANALWADGPRALGQDFYRYQTLPGLHAPERAQMVHSNRGIFVSTPVADPVTGAPTILFSRAIVDGGGNPHGVVSVGVPLSAIVDMLFGHRERASDRIALYRDDRRLIAQYPAESAVGISETPVDTLWRLYPAAAFGRFEQSPGDGSDGTLSVFAGLRPMPLVVVYTFEWRPLSREALSVYWPILAIAVATLTAAIFYALISIRYANALAQANGQLAQAKEHLQFESDERGIFIANMNHELRTPLNAIVGFAQILADNTFGPAHPKYSEYARDIARSGQHLQTLIGEIIDFSAIDQGRRKLDIVPLDIAESVIETVRLLRPVASERSITLAASCPNIPAFGDAVAVRQILINLVTNAIKFSAAGGTVEIECRDRPEPGFVAISVIDHGLGIPPSEMASIGRPFFRTRAARLGAVSGTGLGLSISVALANQMGGRLTLASVPGDGTTVTLLLPMEAAGE